MAKKYFAGCDVGSTYTKAVILDEQGNIVAHTTIRSKISSELILLRMVVCATMFPCSSRMTALV